MKIKEIIKIFRLSNPFNWVLVSERDWSLDVDGRTAPRRFFRNKYYKDDYCITEVYNNIDNRKSKYTLVKEFVKKYRKGELLNNVCYYTVTWDKNHKEYFGL